VFHIGIDVHSKYSEVCIVGETGKVSERRRIATTEASLRRFFGRRPTCRVVLESSSLSPWVYRLLREMGHEAIVVNPRRIRLIAESTLKTDAIDAEILARLSLVPGWLQPIYQRSQAGQVLRARLRARSSLVRSRTALVNAVRGTLRAHGYRLPGGTVASFVTRYGALELDEELRSALDPLAETVAHLTQQIEGIDETLAELSEEDELLGQLQTIPGVGKLVSLGFVAWMDRAERFHRSRDVGACLGLRPRLRASGGVVHRGRITREGDREMRRLLVQGAHAAMRCRRDSQLKRWAEALEKRVGKKKAVVALARKIAVLMHRLWITGERFEAFPAAS
jgi:transposase